ncbi:MAG: hypothetical protein H8K03_14505 [Nitrospira sp.]
MSRKQRHLKTAKNVAKGMSPVSAMVEAGYSESYARSHGYTIVKRPYIQSIVTEAVDLVMKQENKKFDAIVRPLVQALDAPLIVKSTQLGDAQIPKDPETGEPFPDHQTRMAAADRLIELYGGLLKTKTDGTLGPTLEEIVLESYEYDGNGNRLPDKAR